MASTNAPNCPDALTLIHRIHRLDRRRGRSRLGRCVGILAICILLGLSGAQWFPLAGGGRYAQGPGARHAGRDLRMAGEVEDPGAALRRLPAELIEKVRSAVVRIETDRGIGSGFVVDGDGVVVTNYHVVRNTKRATVVFEDQTRAEVLGYTAASSGKDVAVLRIETGKKLTVLALSSELPSQEQEVSSFSYRSGPLPTATQGEVSFTPTGRHLFLLLMDCSRSRRSSGTGTRLWKVPSWRTGYDPGATWVETTAKMFPGCSGGPLVNVHGDVVGMNTMIVRALSEPYYAISSVDIGRLLCKAGAEPRELSTLGKLRKHVAGPETASRLSEDPCIAVSTITRGDASNWPRD